jgi:hypothetical protein
MENTRLTRGFEDDSAGIASPDGERMSAASLLMRRLFDGVVTVLRQFREIDTA